MRIFINLVKILYFKEEKSNWYALLSIKIKHLSLLMKVNPMLKFMLFFFFWNFRNFANLVENWYSLLFILHSHCITESIVETNQRITWKHTHQRPPLAFITGLFCMLKTTCGVAMNNCFYKYIPKILKWLSLSTVWIYFI